MFFAFSSRPAQGGWPLSGLIFRRETGPELEPTDRAAIARTGRCLGAFAILWSLAVVLSCCWHFNQVNQVAIESARIQARTAIQKDIIFRRWNAAHGGVYVTVSPHAQPNPYLKDPRRDLSTKSGQKLTMFNPAYMTRQVHELAHKTTGMLSHLTSLKPLRPANAPDSWETRALTQMAQGAKEVSSVEELHGREHLRLMLPLYTEKFCLKCHAKQGYKLGSLRGGIGVAVPMGAFQRHLQSQRMGTVLTHLVLWALGLVLLGMMFSFLSRQIAERAKLHRADMQKERLKVAMETAGAACHELNQPLQVVMTNAENLLEDLPADSAHRNELDEILASAKRMAQLTARLQRITHYKTKPYADNTRILDLDSDDGSPRSSGG